jgi:hypothetical protein
MSIYRPDTPTNAVIPVLTPIYNKPRGATIGCFNAPDGFDAGRVLVDKAWRRGGIIAWVHIKDTGWVQSGHISIDEATLNSICGRE